ncbi:hypothetical protein BDV06DRAFT_231694 [Aspergillus oleicola]
MSAIQYSMVRRYMVGIICALPEELRAIQCVFDSTDPTPPRAPRDTNTYTVGLIDEHDVVAACLLAGEYGLNAAASVASQMRMAFPAVDFCLLVGVAGGDVVVGVPTGSRAGLFVGTGCLNGPPPILLRAVDVLRTKLELVTSWFHECLDGLESKDALYKYPGEGLDLLLKPDCVHRASGLTCDDHRDYLIQKPTKESAYPYIHYGLVGSGNKLTRDTRIKDRLKSSAIINIVPYLVMRGICDYLDGHKNKVW